jgi:protein-S-isoprenylcysteine O-methyltransferase Ste14
MANQTLFILMATFVISTSGLVVNFIKRGDNEEEEKNDGGTLLWFRVLVPSGLVLSIVFYFLEIGTIEYSEFIINLGYTLVVLGLLLRWYSIWRLGNAFTVHVKIVDNHQLNTLGIYKYIRHPSYTGLILYYLGLALAMENLVSLALLIIAPLFAILYRISQEETVLIDYFEADYLTYKKRSWKLFPFIF